MNALTPERLDQLYSQLCATMSRLGEAQAPLYLARFALLAIVQIGDEAALRRMLAEAAEGLQAPADA